MRGISLTFDDGPDPRWTPRLLDTLGALEARATFFPIACRAARHPRLIAAILEAGHGIGLHCHRHVRHCARDIEWLRGDTARAIAMLRSLGAAPSLWRTPWGELAPWSEQVAAEHGLEIVRWTLDTHDWRGDSAEEMLHAVRPELDDGAVVLAHDGLGPGAMRNTIRETVELVTMIAAHARDRGLPLTALA